MQEHKDKLLKTLAKVVKKHRADKSISQLTNEIALSKSIWSELEKGHKDIQLTTFWRIAESFDIKPSALLKDIENELDSNFSFLESENNL